MAGLLSQYQMIPQPVSLVPHCGKCGLHQTCQSPKMPIDGEGRRGILIVGEAPGRTEDEEGRPFVGRSGVLLEDTLKKIGIDLRTDCWITNAAICRPPDNELPEKAVDCCRANVVNCIRKKSPKVILLLGTAALRSVLGWLWGDTIGSARRWVGQTIPSQAINSWVCPTYHPAYILRERDSGRGYRNEPLELWFSRHIEKACQITHHPWKVVPDYKSRVCIEQDPTRAAALINEVTDKGQPTAFDFETDRLRSEAGGNIICCAISNIEKTVAFPWCSDTIQAMRRFLLSSCPKIAWHMKFEQRWCWSHNLEVNNWAWDGMLGTHAIDSREDSKGLEFQAFAQLGQPPIKVLKEYMVADRNSRNNLHKVHRRDLLLYCGIDTLIEAKLVRMQLAKLGMRLC